MGKVKEALLGTWFEAGGYTPAEIHIMEQERWFVDRTKPVHTVYHIYGRKVGATEDLEKRLKRLRIKSKDKYEVLLETNDLKHASDMERYYQEHYGYHVDGLSYYEIKTMKKHYAAKTGVSYGINQFLKTKADLLNYLKDGIIFIDNDKNQFIFKPKDIPALLEIAEVSKFRKPGTKFDYCFFCSDVVDLRAELDDKRMNVIGQNGNTGEHYDIISGTEVAYEQVKPAANRQSINECSSLPVERTNKTIEDCFKMQYELQRKFPPTENIGPDMTIAEVAAMAQRNLHAFMDEVMEYMDALGGDPNKGGFGNGAWKYWKQDYKKAKEMKISDLSEENLKELKFEFTDMFHFFINWGLMIGMDGQELVDYYVAKNKENFDRQDRGY